MAHVPQDRTAGGQANYGASVPYIYYDERDFTDADVSHSGRNMFDDAIDSLARSFAVLEGLGKTQAAARLDEIGQDLDSVKWSKAVKKHSPSKEQAEPTKSDSVGPPEDGEVSVPTSIQRAKDQLAETRYAFEILIDYSVVRKLDEVTKDLGWIVVKKEQKEVDSGSRIVLDEAEERARMEIG